MRGEEIPEPKSGSRRLKEVVLKALSFDREKRYRSGKEMLEAIRYVDLVIPEENWEQKINDVKEYKADIVVMGSDWANSDKFEYLKDYCEVVYLDRTEGVSTTKIKNDLKD